MYQFRTATALGTICCLMVATPEMAAASPNATGESTFDIPASRLDVALRAFAIQSGRQIIFDADQIAKLSSPGVRGRHNHAEALRLVIGDNSVTTTITPNGVVVAAYAPKKAAILHPAQSNKLENLGNADASNVGRIAQAVPEDSSGGEITVTAQRRAQRGQDVPASIAVVSGAKLDQYNIHSLEDISIRTPGVRVAQAPVSDYLAIRGVGSSLNGGFEQSVGTFVDGVYRQRSKSMRVATFDVAQVEVLKGPQTTYFGNNAIAGAFNITTRKPGHTFEANATAAYVPKTDEFRLEAGASIPLSDVLSVRLAGQVSGMNGYVYNRNLEQREPRTRDVMGRASAHWEPTSTVTVEARVDYGRLRDKGILSTEIENCPAPTVYGAPKGGCAAEIALHGSALDNHLDYSSYAGKSYHDLDFTEAEITSTFNAETHSVILTSGYYHHQSNLLNDFIAVPGPLVTVGGQEEAFPNLYRERFESFSQEARIQSTGKNTLDYMAGLYYQHTTLNLNQLVGYNFIPLAKRAPEYFSPTQAIDGNIIDRQISDTMSAFTTLTWRVTHRLRLNGGLRYSIVDKRAERSVSAGTMLTSTFEAAGYMPASPDAQAAILPFLPFDKGNIENPHRSDNALMPSAGLQYDVNSETMAYFTFTKGFKAGGYSTFLSKASFGPESVHSYEVGVKGSLFHRLITYGLSAYLADYHDLQETTTILLPSGATTQIVGNVAGSRSKGIEFSFSSRPAQGLNIGFDLAYNNAVYTDYTSAPCTVLQSINNSTCVQDLSGKPRAFAPKWTGNLNVDWSFPISGSLSLDLGISPYFTSKFYQQPLADDLLRQPGYAKLDARIAVVSTHGWTVSLLGKNLTNKTTASFRQVLPGSPGSIQALVDQPRTIGLQLSWEH